MDLALAPTFEPCVDDPAAAHLAELIEAYISDKSAYHERLHAKTIRVLAATPASPVVWALSQRLRELAIREFAFRFVFADRGPEAQRDHFTDTLERARIGSSLDPQVLRLVGKKPAGKVNESLVLGDRAAWIGAPLQERSAVQTEFGQIIKRSSAVNLAAMGFDSVRLGSEPWTGAPALPCGGSADTATVHSLFDWRPGLER